MSGMPMWNPSNQHRLSETKAVTSLLLYIILSNQWAKLSIDVLLVWEDGSSGPLVGHVTDVIQDCEHVVIVGHEVARTYISIQSHNHIIRNNNGLKYKSKMQMPDKPREYWKLMTALLTLIGSHLGVIQADSTCTPEHISITSRIRRYLIFYIDH